ncbi:MAG: GTPase [Promethearchaeota archaeon]
MTLRNVAFLGLENAGKTSIIQRIRGDFQPLFANIKTNTVDRYFSEYLGNYLTIWEIPREIFSSHEILSENFSALQNIELVIYIIDIKDSSKFDENLQFLTQIIEISDVTTLKSISVLFHKWDNFKNTSHNKLMAKYQSQINLLMNNFGVNVQFFKTSIYQSFSIISAFSDPLFEEMKFKKPIEILLRNFATNWQINQIYVFTSNFYKLGAVFNDETSLEDEIINDIFRYLQKIDETLNIIDEMEISLNDNKIYFSKFYIEKNKKSYPLYVVWKTMDSNSHKMKKSIVILKKTLKYLISPEITPELIFA